MVAKHEGEPLTAHQRAWKVKEQLDDGAELTMSEIARLTGLTINGAKYMMVTLMVIAPIEEVEGRFRLLRTK